MNYSINDISNGIAKYIDNELMPNFSSNSVERLATGVAVGLFLKQAQNNASTLLSNPFVKMLGITDVNGGVNVDLLREEIKNKMPAEGIKVTLPLLGPATFDSVDVDKLYNYIKG